MNNKTCNCPELGDDNQPFYCGQTCTDKDRIAKVEKWISEHLTEANEGDTVYDPSGEEWQLFCDNEGIYARLIEKPEIMVSLNADGVTPEGITFSLEKKATSYQELRNHMKTAYGLTLSDHEISEIKNIVAKEIASGSFETAFQMAFQTLEEE